MSKTRPEWQITPSGLLNAKTGAFLTARELFTEKIAYRQHCPPLSSPRFDHYRAVIQAAREVYDYHSPASFTARCIENQRRTLLRWRERRASV